jgi:predicted ATP-dependent endonuclease of OLD family
MTIVQLAIDGFRGVAKTTIDFADHTVLIDPNGCGKQR